MSGQSWPEVQNVLHAITPICTSHDDDGVDLYFLNHKSSNSDTVKTGKAASGYYSIRSAETVTNIFTTVSPRGGTPTGQRLHSILRPYLQLLERNKDGIDSVKPINIIVITDGAPSDDVESTVISAAKKLDTLDAPMHQVDSILKVVLGSVVRRLDRRPTSGENR
ncbi:von Willebrand factor [Colletotrichum higginsianum IMI 349063]|uniref:von Willebrand factor n=1 Tax=Colletotrichum higginsianum (strain IMI 349063) TaxID=759273 RepID=A0A1B7XQS3_COLHI|nr:von Willebrand factor [Colletotrichum higginsianum IMI 349063]OBR02101.1 von Willebrand factor [Colletotrichum higginsianum IMI 349063]